jgi:predicted RNA-binding protein YlxR (DUF448 family)
MTKPGEDHGPIRTCVGCRERRPATQLVRCALDASGELVVDRRAPGRGAWLCGPNCWEPARRKRAFDRALRTQVSPDAVDRLGERLGELIE